MRLLYMLPLGSSYCNELALIVVVQRWNGTYVVHPHHFGNVLCGVRLLATKQRFGDETSDFHGCFFRFHSSAGGCFGKTCQGSTFTVLTLRIRAVTPVFSAPDLIA